MNTIYKSFYNAPAPEGIGERKAFIVGGGLAGLAAATFLVTDAHMPGANVTVLEQGDDLGGALDGKVGEKGYLCRGERELEPYMECLWYLCSKLPSPDNEGRTVLDDIVDFNKDEPIHTEARAFIRQGHLVSDMHDMKVSRKDMAALSKLLQTPDSELGDVKVEDLLGPSYFESNMWLDFHTKLAFKEIHSAMEVKRYMQRFTHLIVREEYLEGIIHTKYNEYDQIVRPMKSLLESRGVKFSFGTKVTEIRMDGKCDTVTEIAVKSGGRESTIAVRPKDLVFFTNGSMTQNSRFGDNKTVAYLDRSADDLGVFDVWKKLAARDPKFGHPEKFLKNNIDKMTFVSYFPTIRGFPQFVQRIEEMTGSKAGTGGAISIKDSSWCIGFILHHKPFFIGQPDDVDVFWGNGLYPDRVGDYVKKPMLECTGEEILTEFCYHLGLLDMLDELLKHTYVSVAAMPYITSQFSPRTIYDRPAVVPSGCTNLGFLGQYVEVKDDAVFTVETSVRTAMEAVYTLTGLDKEPIGVVPSKYDLRLQIDRFKKLANISGPITEKDLPKIKLSSLFGLKKKLLAMVNSYPSYDDIMYQGRDKSVVTKVSVLHPKAPLDTEK
jgi:Myosin-crossreactive antigen